jgi:DNA-binding transcriptional LysR family regulator
VRGHPAAEAWGRRPGDNGADSSDLPCIHTGQAWRFEGETNFRHNNIVHRIDELEVAASAVERGLGFAFLPLELAGRVGTVVHVAGLAPVARTLFAVYPTRRLLPSRLRRLIDHMRAG